MSRFVLITGCSSGIGLHVAQALQKAGYEVLASARKQADVEQLHALGLRACRLDLCDEASLEAALAWAQEQAGGALWGLVNNGAYGQPGALEDLPTDALRRQFETNLFGWHHLTRGALPAMLAAGGGRIVQISSVLGLVAMPYRGAYIASKFALEGYTDTLRLELAGTGVEVSLIEPGPIESRFRANALQAFRDHIDIDASRHAERYHQTLARLGRATGEGRFTLGPEACMPPLLHALSHPKPRARYSVTTPTRVFAVLRRLLPARWLDRILRQSA